MHPRRFVRLGEWCRCPKAHALPPFQDRHRGCREERAVRVVEEGAVQVVISLSKRTFSIIPFSTSIGPETHWRVFSPYYRLFWRADHTPSYTISHALLLRRL